MSDSNQASVFFENSQPILRVESMEASLRDRAGIYLCQRSQGEGRAWLWVGVGDVEKLHEEYKARGVTIRLPPTNYPWALSMHIEDPDGNVIRFGSDPK
jgi:predicted enzyme related to lactoylglutathione lyase